MDTVIDPHSSANPSDGRSESRISAAVGALTHRKNQKHDSGSMIDSITEILDDKPSSEPPVTATSHPLFYNASKNKSDYTYVPKKGFGVHKDGGKLNAFTYDCIGNEPRSISMFGSYIDAAKTCGPDNTVNIYKLSNVLLAAFADLVMNTSTDDMRNYLYLAENAIQALSPDVKLALSDLRKGLEYDEGIALALVTDLVSTSNRETIYKKSVEPRTYSTKALTGIEVLNEANLRKVYSALSSNVQTLAVLMSNGVDVNADWVTNLVAEAPTLDELMQMSFGKMQEIVSGRSRGSTDGRKNMMDSKVTPSCRGGSFRIDGDNSNGVASKHETQIIHKMYAGMIGTPHNLEAPPVRRHALESGLTLVVSEQLEEMGQYDLSEVDDDTMYIVAKELFENMKGNGSLGRSFDYSPPSSSDQRISLKGIDFRSVANKLTAARQKALKTAKSVKKNLSSRKGSMPLGSAVRGEEVKTEEQPNSEGSEGEGEGRVVSSNGLASLAEGAGTLSSLLGGGGGTAALAVGGPLGAAIALAPAAIEIASALQDMVDEQEEKLKEEIKETDSARKQIASEVSALLNSLEIDTNSNLEKQKEKVKDLMLAVKRPTNFGVGAMEGMGLMSQLQALTSKFGDTSMEALQPYETDEDIVAGVYGGKALKAVGIFTDQDEAINPANRALLQKPKTVNYMGPALPFRTITQRSTSESSMNSFINSTLNSSLSVAQKSKSSGSASSSVKVSTLFVAINASAQGATEEDTTLNEIDTNLNSSNTQKTDMGTEAFVSEFTFMPMKSFCLREGGLILSEYAYHRLKKVCDAETAKDFLKSFGSHIPMGTQTLGGIFIRTMKMTSRKETKMSDLFSAATVELSKTNKEASKASTAGGFKYGLIGGVKGSASASISTASSSGYTSTGDDAHGIGDASGTSNATFESNVICHGPNAATQESFHQQLNSNNATWTIIDSGEPASYFAIWDMLDYMGQGNILQHQCDLLSTQWRSMALNNLRVHPDDAPLLAELWTFGELDDVLNVSKFLSALISCLFPVGLGSSDSDLFAQFEKVVKGAADAAKKDLRHTSSPLKFVEYGNTTLKFRVVEKCVQYEVAKAHMLTFTSSNWSSFGLAFTDVLHNEMIGIGHPSRLVKLCKRLFDADDDDWNLVKELVYPVEYDTGSVTDQKSFDSHMKESLGIHDQNGMTCAHYATKCNDFTLFKRIVLLCSDILLVHKEGKDIVDFVHMHGNKEMKSFIDSVSLVDVVKEITMGSDKCFHYKLNGMFEIERMIPRFYAEESEYFFSMRVFGNGTCLYDFTHSKNIEFILFDGGIVADLVKIGPDGVVLGPPQVLTRVLRNVALGKKATQSSTTGSGLASYAVDGNLTGTTDMLAHTGSDHLQWWEVDLDGTFDIHAIKIYTREKYNWYQLNNFTVEVIKDQNIDGERVFPSFSESYEGELQMTDYTFHVPGGAKGNKVRLSRTNKQDGFIVTREVQVFVY